MICERHETVLSGNRTFSFYKVSITDYSHGQARGISQAMKNADHFIQSKARFVTQEDNDHDGVMKTIQKMMEDEDGLLIQI